MTSIVHASRVGTGPVQIDDLIDWVSGQLKDCQDLRANSIYPARSLDLELAIAVPAEWSPTDNDWAGDVLRARVQMSGPDGATVRERATAALGLWERALNRSSPDATAAARRELTDLAREFRTEAKDPKTVAPTGLRWTAETIEYVVREGKKVCNEWPPTSQEPCLRVVNEVANTLRVPPSIRDATQFLFRQALLQNAGVYRRRAIDTLRAGGWSLEITDGLRSVLKHPEAEPWFRCRALFALGFLQERGPAVRGTLRESYERALRNLSRGEPSRDLISEMHAAIFAVGDCLGVEGAEAQARSLRDALDPTLRGLVARYREGRVLPIPRSIAYLVAVTAQAKDRPFLEAMTKHDDLITQKVSQWALDSRFKNGEVLPVYSVHVGDAPST